MTGVRAGHALRELAALLVIAALCTAAAARNRTWADAVALWEDAVSKAPNKVRVLDNLGTVYHMSGKYGEALRVYQRVIALQPHLAIHSYGNIGNLFIDTKEYAKAAEVFTRILAINANDYQSYAGRGKALYWMGRYEDAVQDLDRAIGINPAVERYYVYRAEARFKMNDRVRARNDFRTACSKGWDEGCERIKELGLE